MMTVLGELEQVGLSRRQPSGHGLLSIGGGLGEGGAAGGSVVGHRPSPGVTI